MHHGGDSRERLRDDPAAHAYHARVLAEGDKLTEVRHEVRVWAERHGADRTIAEAIELACYEAMANVVLHAYGDGAGLLRLNANAYPAQLQIVVADDGRWREPSPQTHPDGGMGLDLISQLAHRADVDTQQAGTTVSMTWFRDGADQS